MSELNNIQDSSSFLDSVFLPDIPENVLFGVLNWGLGHATRSIPIIRYLLYKGSKVSLASDGAALEYLQQEFPALHAIALPSYNISYSSGSVELSMLSQLPHILSTIKKEAKIATELCRQQEIDMIISDSRFGFRSRGVKSVVISHQLNLYSDKAIFRRLGNIGNRHLLKQFDECWVPDLKDQSLSGTLSNHNFNKPVNFIGPLSRFIKKQALQDIDILAVLSGPEPSRTNLEKLLIPILQKQKRRTVLVQGLVSANVQPSKIENLECYNYLGSEQLNDFLNRSKLVICRSGYSSIMDLTHLEKKAIIIPTPGQGEQEYLAKQLDSQQGFITLKEGELHDRLNAAIKEYF